MRSSSRYLLTLAPFCLLVALWCQNVTIATQDGRDYRVVLRVALGSMALANAWCVAVFFRDRAGRCQAVGMAVPCLLVSLFVVWDFFRRAPYGF